MSDQVEQMFSNLRRGPWNADPTGVPQEGFGGNGNVESQGWLSDGAVTADVIQANAVIAGKIDADAVTAREIAANTITANEIAANTITASQIAANTITSSEIAANTITASDIAANTITANEIAANTLTANEIAANAITATELAANSVTATHIVSNTITASEIAANAITASELAADSVITSKILAGNVTSSRIELTVSGKNFGANDGSASAPGIFFDSASNNGMSRLNLGGVMIPTLVSGGVSTLYVLPGALVSIGGIRPSSDNTDDLGSTSFRYATVYRVAESAVSDERLKRDIADAPLGLDFVRTLQPRVFRWRDTPDTQARESVVVDAEALALARQPYEDMILRVRKAQRAGEVPDAEAESAIAEARVKLSEIDEHHYGPQLAAQRKRRPGKRLHYGLIAQEVKAALDGAGVDSMDAGFWQEAPGGEQSLSYSELGIPVLRAVQELDAQVQELKKLLNQRNDK